MTLHFENIIKYWCTDISFYICRDINPLIKSEKEQREDKDRKIIDEGLHVSEEQRIILEDDVNWENFFITTLLQRSLHKLRYY